MDPRARVRVYMDVTDKVWELVDAVNRGQAAIEDVMTTPTHAWWVDNATRDTLVTRGDRESTEATNVSDTMATFGDYLRDGAHPRSAEFDRAHGRILSWCEVHDMAEHMEEVMVVGDEGAT